MGLLSINTVGRLSADGVGLIRASDFIATATGKHGYRGCFNLEVNLYHEVLSTDFYTNNHWYDPDTCRHA